LGNIDQDIIEFIRNKETRERGFSILINTYQERLYWHIRRIVIDHEDANDVLQNTMVKVFKSIGGFRARSKLYTWLYRIATNESITFLKKKKRRQALSVDGEEMGLQRSLEADPYFDGDQLQLELQKAIDELPQKQKLVFQMRYFDEMSYADMSQVVGTSIGALKASFHHAAKKIEKYLKEIEISTI
jgi:RNA polymerase sigma factor (sigma-70 family)